MARAGFAALAAFIPAQADWLKDRSSTPPTSSTMQALKAADAVEAVAVADAEPPAALLAALLSVGPALADAAAAAEETSWLGVAVDALGAAPQAATSDARAAQAAAGTTRRRRAPGRRTDPHAGEAVTGVSPDVVRH